MIRLVIDIDDTLCDNRGRNYANAKPHNDVINKVNELYKEGYYIILYTARGMKSCNGDIDKIKEKNESVLVDWLNRYNVNYDELVFGKVLGDLYVDDKAMDVRDFVNAKFEKLNGGSNSDVMRLGHIVKKELGSHEKTKLFKEWVKESNGMCLTPHVISYLYNGVYIDFIEGQLLSDSLSLNLFFKLLSIVLGFRSKSYTEFDLNLHLKALEKNLIDETITEYVILSQQLLKKHEDTIIKHASFSHGDCILSNIIVDNNNDLWFIDALMNKKASSYLFDLAKIRMSISGYESRFFGSAKIRPEYKDMLDEILKTLGIYDVVVAIEFMHILRTYRYKKEDERYIVLKMLNKLKEEQSW